jgi:hypothetical protein
MTGSYLSRNNAQFFALLLRGRGEGGRGITRHKKASIKGDERIPGNQFKGRVSGKGKGKSWPPFLNGQIFVFGRFSQ